MQMTRAGGSSKEIQENPPKRIHQRTLTNTKTIFSNKHINKKQIVLPSLNKANM